MKNKHKHELKTEQDWSNCYDSQIEAILNEDWKYMSQFKHEQPHSAYSCWFNPKQASIFAIIPQENPEQECCFCSTQTNIMEDEDLPYEEQIQAKKILQVANLDLVNRKNITKWANKPPTKNELEEVKKRQMLFWKERSALGLSYIKKA